jgi:hypothetical protein
LLCVAADSPLPPSRGDGILGESKHLESLATKKDVVGTNCA